jgi:inosine-uridine nucleoside N-ribohydrolase
VVLLAATLAAHEPAPVGHGPVVIDTDVGIDDVVALSLALQAPRLDLAGIVSTAGAAAPEVGLSSLERLLDRCNRREVPLWAPLPAGNGGAGDSRIRTTVAGVLAAALPEPMPPLARPFVPSAYDRNDIPATILVLGPLTNLAAALGREPDLAQRIGQVVVAGRPDPQRSWNLRADRAAYEAVRTAGVPMTFVVPDERARKPQSWRDGGLVRGRATSVAQAMLQDLLASPAVLDHYLDMLGPLHDELALLYLLHPELFTTGPEPGTVVVADREDLLASWDRILRRGRQLKRRTVLRDAPFPAAVLHDDVLAIRDQAIAAHGEDEWFSQLLLNELHEHLGAYSIIGVKMGLRAAELLNAPPHTMQVISAAPGQPPVSCLNDGLIVATGATPGRCLFRHEPAGGTGVVRATFSCNGREVVLALRDRYRQQIAAEIARIRAAHGLEAPGYWAEVRRFGLEIWRDWHRLDLFEVTATTSEAGGAP